MSINETQRKIYEFLVQRSADGIPPSVREIGAAVGLRSTSSVQSNLDTLEEEGYIQRDPLLKRSIRIMGQAENVTQVPILGTVTAGAPILAVEEIEGYFPYTGTATRDKPLFGLHIRGESMINAGILDGDLVIVEKLRLHETEKSLLHLLMMKRPVKPSIRRTVTIACSRRMTPTSRSLLTNVKFSVRLLL